MGTGRHIAYIVKKPNNTIHYIMYIKSRMTSRDRDKIMQLKSRNQILAEKEQLDNETDENFENRIEQIAKKISRQLGLRYDN